MKRLIICCDGTWQSLSEEKEPTNIFKITQAIKPISFQSGHEIEQVIYYDNGIGAGDLTGSVDIRERLFGGFFGKGIDQKIQDAYFFLCENYVEGDEIYLFGFSRGAYTVRSIAGLINCSGLLNHQHLRQLSDAYDLYRNRSILPSDPKAIKFRNKNGERVPITLLACFDTVGALGVPDMIPLLPIDKIVNRKYQFHDTTLSGIIQNALHAIAIDEHRKVFDVTPMTQNPKYPEQVIKQVWFPGHHGCVGGGEKKHGLSDIALLWMLNGVKDLGLGLEVDTNLITDGVLVNPLENFRESKDLIGFITGRKLRTMDVNSVLHPSVTKRWNKRTDYRPKNLATLMSSEIDEDLKLRRVY